MERRSSTHRTRLPTGFWTATATTKTSQFRSWYTSATEMGFVPTEMEADTGAKPTTMRFSTYNNCFDALPLKRPSTRLLNFDGMDIKRCVGAFRTQVNYGGKKHSGVIHVMDNAYPEVLGRNFLKPLGVKVTCGPRKAKVGIIKKL